MTQAKHTPELSKAAVDDICPQCGSDNLDWGEKDYPDGDQVSVECTCHECDLDFKAWYTLTFDGQTVKQGVGQIDIRPKAQAPDLLAERDRLREINKELLAACKWAFAVLDGYPPPVDDEPTKKYQKGFQGIQTTIAKAEKEKR